MLLPTFVSSSTTESMAILSHRAQSNRRSCQSNQASIPGMWLVDGISVVVAELVNDFGDPLVVVLSQSIADVGLESIRIARQFNLEWAESCLLSMA